MSLYQSVFRPLMFQLDPEAAHNTAMGFLQRGVLKAPEFRDPILSQDLFGLRFENPLGLAAGFDKNAVALNFWHQLGFGFVEVGTVTFHAQPGNERPRMFRLPEDQALINRLGFNNDGARTVAGRLATAKARVPVGVNLGKSKVTELSDAAADYRESFRLLHPFGGYFVVNVSSPNTPGLRSLQEKGPLLEILAAMREVNATHPILVKVAPDLETSALDDVVSVVHEANLAGVIATNTTIGREGLRQDPGQAGGLSGRPLFEKSNEVLRYLYQNLPKDRVLIGVGGIFNGDDLARKIALGAHLAQVYTGWIYGGLNMVPDSLRRLAEIVRAAGCSSISEYRGSGISS